MLALALTVTVLAAPPPARGFAAAHTLELVEQVESRLPKWLTLGGDRKDLLANAKELEAMLLKQGVKKADVKALVDASLAEQNEAPGLQQFTATRVIVESNAQLATVSFFDDGGHRCEVPLLVVGTQAAPRYLLLSGPLTDTRSLDTVADAAKAADKMVVYAEKKTPGGWTTGSRPPPPPADCQTSMKTALKTLFTAEKAWFAEHDSYSKAITKLGVDLTKLGVSGAKVSVAGYPPNQTFTIEVNLRGGVMQMNEKGEATLVGDCTK